MNPLARLREFAATSRRSGRCELCASLLVDDHPHLVQVTDGKLLCSCLPCALLLGQGCGDRFRRVPDRVRRLSAFRVTDAEWDALGIPVELAFFHWSTRLGRRLAFYPSPFGATECLLELHAWDAIAAANPLLGSLQPDVEALLVNRTGRTREAYLVPIDACYRLVGEVRKGWRGFSGGDVREALDRFFQGLRSRSVEVS